MICLFVSGDTILALLVIVCPYHVQTVINQKNCHYKHGKTQMRCALLNHGCVPTYFDTEVAICGYQSYRIDRNRHGGGVIVYVRSCFVTTLIPVLSHGLELILVTFNNGVSRVCTSVFFSPPPIRHLLFVIFKRFIFIPAVI